MGYYLTDNPKKNGGIACLWNGDDFYVCRKCARQIKAFPGAEVQFSFGNRWYALAPDRNPEKECHRCDAPLKREA